MTQRLSFQDALTVIKLNLDIVTIVGRYVQLRRAGRNLSGLCPFHNEKTPSFSVSPEKQLFKCFGCGEGGDALSFLMKIEHQSFGEVIAQLAQEAGIEIERSGQSPEVASAQAEQERLFKSLYQEATLFYQHQRTPHIDAYLAERGLTPETITAFGLGYAPEAWQELTDTLSSQHPELRQTPALLETAGLAILKPESQRLYDRFRDRLIIPIWDDQDQVVAFGGRAMGADQQPKYLNSPETPIYNKSQVLYGLNKAKSAIREQATALIMEGYFDVIAAHQAGFSNAVGVCGTALTPMHLKKLQRAGAKTLYLCFDSDSAGQKAALRAIELVESQAIDQQLKLRVIQLPDEKDPADFLMKHPAEDFAACQSAAQDYLAFKIDQALGGQTQFETPEARVEAVAAITPVLVAIQQPTLRHETTKQLAEKIGVPEETLHLEIKQLEKRNAPYSNKKNLGNHAISVLPERFPDSSNPADPISGVSRGTQTPPLLPLSQSTRLAHKQTVAEKEALLVSYALINPECYRMAMAQTTQTQSLTSPMAKELLTAIATLDGQWQNANELTHHLITHYRNTDNEPMVAYIAERAMVIDEIQDAIAKSNKGLKFTSTQDRLNRDMAEIVQKIRTQQQALEANTLAKELREMERGFSDSQQATPDDVEKAEQAVLLQKALREKITLRQRSRKLSSESSSVTVTVNQPLGEEP